MSTDVEKHSKRVRQFYNALRVTLLNKKYYGRRLSQYKRYNFVMELLIALGTTGSGVAAFAVWKTSIGTVVWPLIAGASAALAIAKPLLKLTEQIETYAKLYAEYTAAFEKMKLLIDDLQIDKAISMELIGKFNELRVRSTELAGLGDPMQDKALIGHCQREVNSEIDTETLWDPAVDDG